MGWISWIVSIATGIFVIWIEEKIINAILDAFHASFPNDPLLSAIIFILKVGFAVAAAIVVFSLFSSHSSSD